MKAVGGIGGGVWLLAEERLTGKSLDRWEGHLSGQVLTEVWAEVAKLHEAGIAHRDLRLSNTFVDDNGEVWLIDLSYGEPTASDHLLLHDRAELLAATACVVGSQAAVEYATTAIGHEALAGVDDLLDPVALSRATRLNARRSPELLPALRTAVQESAGGPRKIASEAHRLEMIRMSGLLAGIGLSYLTIVLLAGAADVFEELGDVGWRWIGVAITAALIAVLARAVGRWGADRRHLHLGTVVRDGLPRVDSLAGTSSSEHPIFAFVVACAIGLALAGLLVENTVLQDLAGEWTAVGAVAITLAASVTFLTWQQLSRGHRPAGMTTVVPEAVTVTLGGYSVALSATVICLLASSTAVGAAVPSGALAVVCLAATTMTAFGPTSGAGIAEPALTVGMIAFGAEPAAAVAAALVFSATWIWLPVAIGAWFRRSTVGPGEPRFGEHAERLVQSGTSSG